MYVSVVGPVGFMVKTDGKWQFGTAQAYVRAAPHTFNQMKFLSCSKC